MARINLSMCSTPYNWHRKCTMSLHEPWAAPFCAIDKYDYNHFSKSITEPLEGETIIILSRMVGEWMMDPIKIPWFRRPGSSWSLVYLVRGGSRPNLTEGSLSAAMGCVVQGYLIDLGGAIWRLTTRFRGPRVITVYPAVPFSGKTAAALRRRPRVGAASECVRPSRLPIEAVTVLSRVRVLKFPRSLIRAVTRYVLGFRLEEEDEVEGEEEEEERERKWEGMVGNLKRGRKKKKNGEKEGEGRKKKKNGGRGMEEEEEEGRGRRRNLPWKLGWRGKGVAGGLDRGRTEGSGGFGVKCRGMRVRGGLGDDMRGLSVWEG
ncbi:hypothetical protein M5K25_000023 [Dendrobium thyrsiflorum]|uniref:Uncharacterized protein n=1 Tax=Dendrobium thyrsiflorum TaxID=117978 RepID=A0ABD0VTA6_DENTH